jgi:uncharacterized protein
MPIAPTYPGVYVQELPSGVRTITGVATSITAFLGRALRGPVDEPTTIFSFGDFERIFGGLAADMPLGYAVLHFFLNGGSQAIIVRLFKPVGAGTGVATQPGSPTGLPLAAASPGLWANGTPPPGAPPNAPPEDGLAVMLDNKNTTDLPPAGLQKSDLFNLTIYYKLPGAKPQIEILRNVSVKEGPRRVDRLLEVESQYVRYVGDILQNPPVPVPTPVAAKPTDPPDPTLFFTLGGPSAALQPADITDLTLQNTKSGMYALDNADLFNLLSIPADTRDGYQNAATHSTLYGPAMTYCAQRRAMLIVDPLATWKSANAAEAGMTALTLTGLDARNAAMHFPLIMEPDSLQGGQLSAFGPSGAVAGVMARTDSQRGIWKAPAGIDATLTGAQGLTVLVDNNGNGQLNPLGLNILRNFPGIGNVVWGARTLRGADRNGDEYKYIPIRRLALYIEESLYRGLKWVVFEPNDEPLWSQIRLNAGSFMHDLFRQGAFQGQSAKDAYFVKCDAESTTPSDRDHGIVNIIVGFAPLKPAEFVILSLQQMAGQTQV